MKTMLFAAILLSSLHAAATPCLSRVLENHRRALIHDGLVSAVGGVSQARLNCVAAHPEFVESAELLCRPNQETISSTYELYLQYRKAWWTLKAQEGREKSADRKMAIQREMNTLEMGWHRYGYRQIVEHSINVGLKAALVACPERRALP